MWFSLKDVFPGREQPLHHFGIARNLLFIAGGELLDFELSQHGAHFDVCEFSVFVAC